MRARRERWPLHEVIEDAAGRGRGGSPARDEQLARGGGVARTSTRGARLEAIPPVHVPSSTRHECGFRRAGSGRNEITLDVRSVKPSRVIARTRHRWRVPSSSATPTAPWGAQGWSQSRARPRKCDATCAAPTLTRHAPPSSSHSGRCDEPRCLSPEDDDGLRRVAPATARATSRRDGATTSPPPLQQIPPLLPPLPLSRAIHRATRPGVSGIEGSARPPVCLRGNDTRG